MQWSNHKSAISHIDIIEANIKSELSKDRIKLLFRLLAHYFYSFIDLVLKKSNGIQIDWRIIFDFFFSKSFFVNDEISKEFDVIFYKLLNIIIRLIAEISSKVILMKRDLKYIFHYISVNSLDHWLLIFEWNDKFYINIFLLFRLRTASRIFNLFVEALYWIFEELLKWKVTHYLNDFLFIFSSSIDINKLSKQYDNIIVMMSFSGAMEKNMDDHVITHLEFEFDILKMKVCLSVNKKLHALQVI